MIAPHSHKQRNAGFTLIEVLVSVVLSGMLLASAFASFQGILRSQVRLSGVINIQRNLFYLNEKLSSLIQDGGTIDYEEYFNRRVLGYDTSLTDEGWTYTTESHYGNGDNPGGPELYFCWADSTGNEDACLNSDEVSTDKTSFDESLTDKQMAYGQYSQLGFNYNSQAGFPTPMRLPPIFASDNLELRTQGMNELYLIKKLTDSTYERTYFRHIYIQDPTTDESVKVCAPGTDISGCLGKLQMTRLVSCDTLPNDGDITIDAWVPHSDFWGGEDPCTAIDDEDKISTAAEALVWADISTPEMNITRAGFLPSPLKIPGKMAWAGEEAFSPMVQLHLEVKLAQSVLARGLLKESENTPRFLTTSFDLDSL